jgi:hypothetical protein
VTKMRIPLSKESGIPLLCHIWLTYMGIFKNCPREGSETLNISSERLGETFEGDSSAISAGKFPLMSMAEQIV